MQMTQMTVPLDMLKIHVNYTIRSLNLFWKQLTEVLF